MALDMFLSTSYLCFEFKDRQTMHMSEFTVIFHFIIKRL